MNFASITLAAIISMKARPSGHRPVIPKISQRPVRTGLCHRLPRTPPSVINRRTCEAVAGIREVVGSRGSMSPVTASSLRVRPCPGPDRAAHGDAPEGWSGGDCAEGGELIGVAG